MTLSTCPVFTSVASSKVYEVPAPTPEKPKHKKEKPTKTYTAGTSKKTKEAAYPTAAYPTATYVPYTGGASSTKGSVGGGVAFGLLGGVLGVAMLDL